MNKNVSIWRGSEAPPTKHHVWINEENDILLHNGSNWVTIVDDNNYEDLKQHLAHFPTVNKTDIIPTDATDLLDNEFRLYEITQNSTVLDYINFNKNESFLVKLGDLYLLGKIPVDSVTSESISPILNSATDAINKPISLVFKEGEVEMDWDGGTRIIVSRRKLTPTWIIEGTSTLAYIKHISLNKYLHWNGSVYTLSTDKTTSFAFINYLARAYEIRRNGTSQCLNPLYGNQVGNYISEYYSGDANNFIYIVDPSLYKLPRISSNTLKTFNKGEGFTYDLLFTHKSSSGQTAYINCDDSDVKVKFTPSKFYLCGTYDNLAIINTKEYVLEIENGTVIQNPYTNGLSKNLFCLIPHGYTSNTSFAICYKSNKNLAFNPHQGILEDKPIKLFDTSGANNSITFIPHSEVINKHIPMSNATSSYSGLMSKEDKAKLDNFLDSSKYKTTQTAKSSPSANGSTYQFIDTITQNAQGVITATKKSVRNASQLLSGLMSSSDKTKLDNITTINWSVLDHLLRLEIKSTSPINLTLKNELIPCNQLYDINLLELYSINDIINITIPTKASVVISHNDITIQDDTDMYQDLTLSAILSSEVLSLYIRKGLDISIKIIPWSLVRFNYNQTYTHLFPAHKALTWKNIRPYISNISIRNNEVYYDGYFVTNVSVDDVVLANSTYNLHIP